MSKLNPLQVSILTSLLEGPKPVRDIAIRVSASRAGLARELMKLKEMGLITSEASEEGMPKQSLTDQGRSRMDVEVNQPRLEIQSTSARGVEGEYLVIMLLGEKCHCYLHTDSVWRATCAGPEGLQAYFKSHAEASFTLRCWMNGRPEFDSIRPNGGKPVRVRK